MKALVYHGPGKRALEDKPKPVINAPTDAIVKITKTKRGRVCLRPREPSQSLHQSLQAQKDGVTREEIVLRGRLLDRAISSVLLPPWHQN